MKIYLDHNVIVYLRGDPESNLSLRIKAEKEKGCKFVFSPAHLEEIAVSCKRHNAAPEIIDRDIRFLTELCGNNSLRPLTMSVVEYGGEYPIDCYQRVIADYSLNDLAEELESQVITDSIENPWGNPKEVNNVDHTEILNKIIYAELIIESLYDSGLIGRDEVFKKIKDWPHLNLADRFDVFEHSVNVAANILEKVGYYREGAKKYRSRLHDVSHMIYGRYVDVVVSNDEKFLKKTKAIYSFLEVSTKVLSLKEFESGF